MRPVTVQFLKNPDILHWGFDVAYLGEDEWGDWMAVPAGTRRWKGEEDFRPTALDAVFVRRVMPGGTCITRAQLLATIGLSSTS